MANSLKFALVVVVCSVFCLAGLAAAKGPQRPSRAHQVYFEGTDDELNIYRVYGEKPGPTLMIIGGIQGDEPGGFLTADLYADIALAKGDLIVVPRANLYSIILGHRGPDGDMNRQFGDPVTAARHKKIVAVLKNLMAGSNFLLNLHEGSGFYYPKFISKQRNPMRYGQCLIADTDTYRKPDGSVINLERLAERVLARVNPQIKQDKYHFHFNNHRTAARNSRHKEQRKSATFFALTNLHIPAFGVETSKSLPSVDLKVRYHSLVINGFMKELGIIPENPGLYLAKPYLKYLVVSVNDRLPVVLKKDATLAVASGDTLKVLHIEANYERGLTADVEGVGTVNDLHRAYHITKPTRVVARKDGFTLGKINVAVAKPGDTAPAPRLMAGHLFFLVDVGGKRQMVKNRETLQVVRGDVIKVVDVINNLKNQSDLKVNFKGFVPRGGPNLGEDRGHDIDTGRDLLSRYATACKGPGGKEPSCFPVQASKGGRIVGVMTVRVIPAKLQYMVVKRGGNKLVYHDGEEVKAKPGETFKVLDIKTNAGYSRNLSVAVECGKHKLPVASGIIDTSLEPVKGLLKKGPGEMTLVVFRGDQAIGHVRFHMKGN